MGFDNDDPRRRPEAQARFQNGYRRFRRCNDRFPVLPSSDCGSVRNRGRTGADYWIGNIPHPTNSSGRGTVPDWDLSLC